MSNNTFVMREEEMDIAVNGLDKCYTNAENAGKSMDSNFSSIKKTGLFDVGINAINKQINSISTSLFNVKNIVNKNSNSMFEMDRQLSSMAEKIEIPQDFVKNKNIFSTEFNNMIMQKNDGVSVNQGQSATNNVEVDTQSSIVKNTLGNINNQNSLNMPTYEDNIVGNKPILNNKSNNENPVKQELNDNFSGTNVNLKNITNSQNIDIKNIDSNFSATNVNLKNINNDSNIAEQQINDQTSITKTDINNNLNYNSVVGSETSTFEDKNN